MKKILLVIILVVMLIMGLAPTLFAADRSSNLPSVEEVKSAIVAKNTVEVNTTGILPTSPFYFIKEFRRGVRLAFTINPIARAEYELKVASEKAAELQKLEELGF